MVYLADCNKLNDAYCDGSLVTIGEHSGYVRYINTEDFFNYVVLLCLLSNRETKRLEIQHYPQVSS